MTHVTCRLTAKNLDQLRTLRSVIEYGLPLPLHVTKVDTVCILCRCVVRLFSISRSNNQSSFATDKNSATQLFLIVEAGRTDSFTFMVNKVEVCSPRRQHKCKNTVQRDTISNRKLRSHRPQTPPPVLPPGKLL